MARARNKFPSPSVMTMAEQAAQLRYFYPESKVVNLDHGNLIWRCELTPSEISDIYTIEIRYFSGEHPKMYVVKPKPLMLHPGATELPHVFNHERQEICTHFFGEWNWSMPLATTYGPWASRWLHSYETWVVTGTWIGHSFHNGVFTD